jgi:adenosine/AMP kinase
MDKHGISVDIKVVKVKMPENTNVIVGQTHFIKSVEDLYEAMVTAVPKAMFGVAFAEASGACLIRYDGNDKELMDLAVKSCSEIRAGHTFVICMKDAYPINVLNTLKTVQEVCSIFCASANVIEVVIAESDFGRGILGVIDGSSPKGVEGDKDKKERIEFLKKIGYKR